MFLSNQNLLIEFHKEEEELEEQEENKHKLIFIQEQLALDGWWYRSFLSLYDWIDINVVTLIRVSNPLLA